MAAKIAVVANEPLQAASRPSLALQLARHPTGRWGMLIVVTSLLVALLAPQIAPRDPYNVEDRAERMLAPSASHLLGTDGQGIDIFSQIVYGTRVSLSVGIVTALIISIVGAVAGIMAGYLGGWADALIMRVADILFTIPSLPLMILLATYLGPNFLNIVFIFTVLGWAGLARTIRSQVLSLRTRPYVDAATVCGADSIRIMARHILPGVSSLVIVSGAMMAAGMMLAEAGLSFLNLGDPRAVSWGRMLSQAQSGHAILLGVWWWIIPPGLAIFVTTLGFMLLGYALEEIVNPYLRRSPRSG